LTVIDNLFTDVAMNTISINLTRMPLNRKVTVSIGVASCDKTIHTSKALIEKADAALYQAKNNGKNRVVISREPGVQMMSLQVDHKESATPGYGI
jgi:diguanylate cyclase (GGDEF)-like protein